MDNKDMPAIKILPSLLAADMGHLAREARRAEEAGGDALHIDIMDAHFVPNLSMGPDVVAMARRAVRLPLSVHLMMTNPERYLERFIAAGADILLIHIEIKADVADCLRRIRKLGARPGITLNPETHASALDDVLNEAEEVLCMSVHPGYGGQVFMPETLDKIAALRRAARQHGRPALDISVDGGINLDTAAAAAAAGANVFIAGTSLYGVGDMKAAIAAMRDRAAAAWSLSSNL